MTRRGLLIIIHYQLCLINRMKRAVEIIEQELAEEAEARVQMVINDTNQWMAKQEQRVTLLIEERDKTWQDNLNTIWEERQEILKQGLNWEQQANALREKLRYRRKQSKQF